MILDIVIHKSDDGFTAEIPSLRGCESWAHDQDTVLKNIFELASYYLKTDISKFKLDKARETKTKIIYKLVFDKTSD
jgi:predicted RNase H-like HicB family nuclease